MPYIRCPLASLDYVVEGWFLGPSATGPGGPKFASWSKERASKYSTSFVSSLSDLPVPSQPCVVLISGRTADNPCLLIECISAECKAIYLEKPGMPTVSELQKMRDEAESTGIAVLMGSTRTCASTWARLASSWRLCRGPTSPLYQTTRTSEFPLSFSFLSLLPFFCFPVFLSLRSCVCIFCWGSFFVLSIIARAEMIFLASIIFSPKTQKCRILIPSSPSSLSLSDVFLLPTHHHHHHHHCTQQEHAQIPQGVL
jgi:hypothetical protein